MGFEGMDPEGGKCLGMKIFAVLDYICYVPVRQFFWLQGRRGG